MFNFKSFLTIIFLFLAMTLSSCVPPQANSRSTSSSANENTTEDDTDDDTSSPNISSISWYSSGQLITGVLAQNANATSSYYIRGNALSDYITKNSKQASTFCMVASFNNLVAPAKKQLRFKAIPFRILNSSEFALRIEIVSAEDNKIFCKGDNVPAYDANDSVTANINEVDSAFTYNELCPTCTQTFLSDSIKIFESVSGNITSALPISRTVLNLLSLRLKVDVTNNQTSDNNTCSLTKCQAEGFDCCLDGQCVKDGVLRPNPDATSLALALYDVSLLYSNFKKWPTVYYVCQENTTPPDDDDDDDTDPINDANQELLALIKDYECLQGDATKCDPDLLSVQQRTWKMCGCLMDPITNDPLDPRCPDYTLKTITDSSGNIQRVECSIPVDEVPAPFQNLNINVSAKTAPHRFFNNFGKNYDDLADVPVGEDQEGEEFIYLDERNKVGPVASSFNMNAVLGNMSIAMDKAIPATVINLELDQSYIIRANTGFYTPCATCQFDPWYSIFSSHPEVSTPFGLSFKNYTTKREAYGYNVTNGNYEDTIFGRACWLPPTMLPFSHKSETTVNSQRRNRLETQAALFVNGYQRDWFGFNKGALIGSFDGVNWFAVGNGRRVQSTSTKLFLAINAPFADVAEATSYNVSVIQDLGGQTASNFDWDFDIDFNATGQNPAASCQYMHSCEADTDCISKLGWEYACADVNDMKTSWPRFNIDASEKANSALANTSLNNILISGLSGDSQKRCVYRGAGSLCKVNNDVGITSNQQKLLTCAPNFYCASLNSPSFNKEVKRSTNDPTNINFGQGANILGRPKTYVGANGSLTTQIRTNILSSIASYPSASATEYGLCVPGRSSASSNVNTQHRTKDTANRTDYISQIGTCNSNSSGNSRVYACPAIDSTGNLVRTGTPSILSLHNQNMCGAESQTTAGNSTFNSIEKDVLTATGLSINTPSFARDACFRRAGSVCHTDLDCAPNIMHAEQALTLGITNFGGTQAEFDFWKEELVCGQAQSAPIYGASTFEEYKDYNMNQNRCCREISKDFTMYTEIQAGANRDKIAGYDSNNDQLVNDRYPYTSPSATGRYSRYAVASTGISVEVNPTTVPSGSQWKTINETGSKNCCGGGFVRKFDDGTTNWNVRNRLRLSPENYACLNYKTRLYKESANDADAFIKGNWTADYSYLCLYPKIDDDGNYAGCIQENMPYESVPYALIESIIVDPAPYTNKTNAQFSTYPGDDFDGSGSIDLSVMVNESVVYPPTIFKGKNGFTNELMIFRNSAEYDNVNPQDRVISFYLPSYITNQAAINTLNITIQVRGEDYAGSTTRIAAAHLGACTYAGIIGTSNSWCIGTDGSRSYMSIFAQGDAVDNWQWGWVEFQFTENNPLGAMKPGSAQYYEQRLSKFELLGVPQVTYNYVACNDSVSANPLTLIPGIFEETTIPAASLQSNRIHYTTDSSTIKHSQIFSANDFRCCSEVGNKVDVPTKCCSGYGERTGSEVNYTCKLPSGTNLHLYLNKFISSEGSYQLEDANDDEERLLETDFDSETGFPKYTAKVYNLIQSFGEDHCSSKKVREGGAVGNFSAQPGITGSTDRLSIVDSPLDYDGDTGAGYGAYMSGYRWNIHSYCE